MWCVKISKFNHTKSNFWPVIWLLCWITGILARILRIISHNLIWIRIYPLPYPYLCQNLLPYFIFICLINSDTDNFHFHFGSDADVSDTNRHFLEYEYRIFRIIHYHFPPLILPARKIKLFVCFIHIIEFLPSD